jgi:hypothetical protein
MTHDCPRINSLTATPRLHPYPPRDLFPYPSPFLHDPNPTLPFELLHLRITLPNLLNINSVGAGASTDNVSIPREVKVASNIKAASVMRVDLTKTVFEGAECFFLFSCLKTET